MCKAKSVFACDYVRMCEWAGGYKSVDKAKKSSFSHIALTCATSQVLRIHTNALVVVATCINVQNRSSGINIQLRSKGHKAMLGER